MNSRDKRGCHMFVSHDNTVRSHLQSKPGKIDEEPRKITLALTF